MYKQLLGIILHFDESPGHAVTDFSWIAPLIAVTSVPNPWSDFHWKIRLEPDLI